MQRFSGKRLQGWAAMALFAMLAVLVSPSLAFACCCGQETAAPAPQVAPASHPGCHGHAEADTPKTQSVGESSVSASNSLNAAPVVTSASQGPCFKSLCECEHARGSVLAFVEAQNTSSFSPLVLGVAVQAFSPAVTLPSSVRFAFASSVARPRGPDIASRSGRAPPAFSL